MSSVKLYLFGASPPCRSVLLTAKALDFPLELKYLDFQKREHLQEAFKKINPLHKTPTIVEGDFILWESRAIMRYLVGKYGGEDNSLYPRDLQKRARVDSLLDHDLGVFYKAMLEDLMMLARHGKEPTEEQKKKVEEAFDWLDNQVKDTKFVAGNDLTIADFAIVVGFTAIAMYRDGVDKYKNALAWFSRMKELPYFEEVNKPFYDIVNNLKKSQMASK